VSDRKQKIVLSRATTIAGRDYRAGDLVEVPAALAKALIKTDNGVFAGPVETRSSARSAPRSVAVDFDSPVWYERYRLAAAYAALPPTP
jgi:hypothetical protein